MVTLREVAQRAGVSIKTVSRIVNGDGGVATQLRADVQRHIDALGYTPNHAARTMRSGQSSLFGLMTDVVATTPYSVEIVRGVQAALTDADQTLIIANSDGDPEREAQLWRMFRAHSVAGVIYAAMYHRPHALEQPAYDRRIVLANCFPVDGAAPSIIPDDEGGGYLQARYLLERGHRRIGLITLSPTIEATRLRGAGIRKAFRDAGLVFPDLFERVGVVGPIRQEKLVAYEAARDLLSQPVRPTAIICGNDQLALQVYGAAASLGLSVPDDLSVIGFDDFQLISQSLRPMLTTVALPYFDIGRRAVELMNTTDTSETGDERLLVPCPLVERQSCRALA